MRPLSSSPSPRHAAVKAVEEQQKNQTSWGISWSIHEVSMSITVYQHRTLGFTSTLNQALGTMALWYMHRNSTALTKISLRLQPWPKWWRRLWAWGHVFQESRYQAERDMDKSPWWSWYRSLWMNMQIIYMQRHVCLWTGRSMDVIWTTYDLIFCDVCLYIYIYVYDVCV